MPLKRFVAVPVVLVLVFAAACSDQPLTTDVEVADQGGVYPVIGATDPVPSLFENGPALAHGEGILTNGSFESGFAGWAISTVPNIPFRPWNVTGAGFGDGFGMAPTDPQDGSQVAWNGFDGGGPMTFSLWQDVALPSGQLELGWQDRFQWNFGLGGIASQPRLAFVEIRNPADNAVLATVFNFSTGTQAQNPTGDTGWQTHTADISAFAGTSVRIFFRQFIPQSFTGPAQFEVDHVTIQVLDPQTKDDCKNGGWEQFGFRNQGQCVRFIETGKDSRA